jgi:diguanylate cyclase (GGDEF)-like protein
VRRRANGVYAVLMIDVDKLNDINDAFGHDAGNSALTLVAQCLQRSIRNSDCAARFAGDEFAVLLPGASPEVAEAVVKRVRHNVYKTTLDLRSRMIRCSVSIGVANYPKDGRDVRELLSVADRMMYRDKELRRAGRPANGGKCLNLLDICGLMAKLALITSEMTDTWCSQRSELLGRLMALTHRKLAARVLTGILLVSCGIFCAGQGLGRSQAEIDVGADFGPGTRDRPVFA